MSEKVSDIGGMCSCEYDYDQGQTVIYSAKICKARKAYICCECGGQIHPGEKYERASSLCDGSWNTCKTHISCAGIRRDFCCDIHGSVAETFESTYGFNPYDEVSDAR